MSFGLECTPSGPSRLSFFKMSSCRVCIDSMHFQVVRTVSDLIENRRIVRIFFEVCFLCQSI